ncbi:hypothetical protein [Natrialba sp. PRR66]|uniref:hypothetical protein n=1 Tax=Natrialba sp. PRR66 TaxID=3098146 RepID=UPI002B1DDE2F|nr:hypothetical protein [Natrialba sp. PRR66]
MGDRDTETQGSQEDPDLAYSEVEPEQETEQQPHLPETGEYEIESLRFICSESRDVIDHQIDDLDDIDDKALRTVRITMVVFGLLVAAAQIEGSDPIFNRITVLGGGLLLLSIIAGAGTYSASDLHLGPGPNYLIDVVSKANTEKKERVEALGSYAYWMYENERIVRRNGTYLIITQLLLVLGLLCLAYGAFTGVTDENLYEFMAGMIVI